MKIRAITYWIVGCIGYGVWWIFNWAINLLDWETEDE